MKTPALATIALLSLLATTVQAEDRTCLTGAPGATVPAVKLEAAMRSGQITPYEAGRLMRQQWEIAQFQRGFLEDGQCAHAGSDEGCASNLNLAPIGDMASSMAKTGMQTATTVMRALIRETRRLIKEDQAARAMAEDPAP